MITVKEPLSWFDEMNLRYIFKKMIASVFGLSEAMLVVTESSYSAAKAMEEFGKMMAENYAKGIK